MSGIYIHIPFCKQACHYCDFHFSTSLKKRDELVKALAKELEMRKSEFQNTTVETIYFGGGTPSLLSVKELEFLIQQLYAHYNVSEAPEITLEANPDDLIEAQRSPQAHANDHSSKSVFQAYRRIGINRLSIGIQSFFEEDLKLMNRAHNTKDAKTCLEEATRYFDNISIDLIYGIPGSSNAQWLENVNLALSYKIPHISSYALTVEPKTALKTFIDKGIISNVDDASAEAQFQILVNTLKAHGFIHYELSNFGREGFFSRNNSAYWQGKSYLGIGPSAHSFNGNERSWNIRNNSKYIAAIEAGKFPKETEVLSITDKYNEYVMTGLRTIWGVYMPHVVSRYGEDYKSYLLEQADTYIQQQLLYIENERLLVTKKGQFLSDGIAASLFRLN
ncbi:MAG: radical SAM family heme chaperone HemW [Psychroserpens sp.]|uniref:radical SAM family heme chaperone HemW n=1 Tax=Psychroserpens sp. TaxID=2020870 RepID=UPI003CA6EB4F